LRFASLDPSHASSSSVTTISSSASSSPSVQAKANTKIACKHTRQTVQTLLRVHMRSTVFLNHTVSHTRLEQPGRSMGGKVRADKY
jgi:hypothetical protein